jgi:DNA repair exonuclease SbcCD ATPase subunit
MGFFDKLKEQASSLGGQLDQALDGTRQKSQVGSLRKKRGEMITELGESLVEQFRQGQVNVEELRPQVDQIFSVEREMIEAEQQIEAQRQAAAQAKMAQAPAPQAPPAPQAQAAPPPPPPPAPQAAGAAACPSCGTEIPEGSAFCPNCGAKAGG